MSCTFDPGDVVVLPPLSTLFIIDKVHTFSFQCSPRGQEPSVPGMHCSTASTSVTSQPPAGMMNETGGPPVLLLTVPTCRQLSQLKLQPSTAQPSQLFTKSLFAHGWHPVTQLHHLQSAIIDTAMFITQLAKNHTRYTEIGNSHTSNDKGSGWTCLHFM